MARAIKTSSEARYSALAIRRRLDEVARMAMANPGLVRVATGDGGDRLLFWYEDGQERQYNVSVAQRQLADIQRMHPEALRSRSGASLVELPLALR